MVQSVKGFVSIIVGFGGFFLMLSMDIFFEGMGIIAALAVVIIVNILCGLNPRVMTITGMISE